MSDNFNYDYHDYDDNNIMIMIVMFDRQENRLNVDNKLNYNLVLHTI